LTHDGQDDYSHNDDWRVIHQDSIDAIQSEELGNDDYLLGCFNASFLASVLDIDVDVIQSMQEAEAYEAIGKLINSMDKIEELQTRYSTMDGYGHHFAHYDHETHEIGDYYLFRTN